MSNYEDYQKMVTQEFISALEQDGLEWNRGYDASMFQMQNGASGRLYTGFSQLYLSMVAKEKQYSDPRWFTFNQIADRQEKFHKGEKWHLKRGSKGSPVQYWFAFNKATKKGMPFSVANKLIKEGICSAKDFMPCSKTYTVFNGSQIEGLTPYKVLDEIENRQININNIVDTISQNMGVLLLVDNSNSPHYIPARDVIYTPDRQTFENDYEFNSTVLHELSHATGHASRLNRPGISFNRNSQEYAIEELIAEISSAFMGGYISDMKLSDKQMESHKAYVKSWIGALKDDPKILGNAIKDAQKASNYLQYKGEIIDKSEYKRRGAVNLNKVEDTQDINEKKPLKSNPIERNKNIKHKPQHINTVEQKR